MHSLIVTSHPLHESLTNSVARQIAAGLVASDPTHTYEIADIATEGFDPRFTAVDIAAFNRQASLADDVLAEQQRVERADALVLVFPIYWWSMPALLKGWIDRVFSNGWAYDDAGELIKKLTHLPVHIIGIGAAAYKTYINHGFAEAMKIQIEHGIFNFCGAPVMSSTVLLLPDLGGPEQVLEAAYNMGTNIFACETAAG
ncbi:MULTISPECIES: NAD(P)H-dependent oxidoreductase [Yersinia]|uniref:NAD(P)H-dependent oxidoreductase n=1 Tax=Yersinia TaxID=629 RepID=UPI0009B6F7C6|nr:MULTISPECIES: NAD(P)H-dependent oxidoreductase [Yersinia]ARB83695.1 flavodoxin family protein [Yersinia sp. FDAARGOS_228]AVL37477.1 flavodoxin family protein [Yersinia intermedia]